MHTMVDFEDRETQEEALTAAMPPLHLSTHLRGYYMGLAQIQDSQISFFQSFSMPGTRLVWK